MIFWRKIMIFHTKYPKNFAPPFARHNFFKCTPPNLKSWIRTCIILSLIQANQSFLLHIAVYTIEITLIGRGQGEVLMKYDYQNQDFYRTMTIKSQDFEQLLKNCWLHGTCCILKLEVNYKPLVTTFSLDFCSICKFKI